MDNLVAWTDAIGIIAGYISNVVILTTDNKVIQDQKNVRRIYLIDESYQSSGLFMWIIYVSIK